MNIFPGKHDGLMAFYLDVTNLLTVTASHEYNTYLKKERFSHTFRIKAHVICCVFLSPPVLQYHSKSDFHNALIFNNDSMFGTYSGQTACYLQTFALQWCNHSSFCDQQRMYPNSSGFRQWWKGMFTLLPLTKSCIIYYRGRYMYTYIYMYILDYKY